MNADALVAVVNDNVEALQKATTNFRGVIFLAVAYNSPNVLKFAVRMGDDPRAETFHINRLMTPLKLALIDHPNLVPLLLDLGAAPESVKEQSTLLHMAAKLFLPDVLRLFYTRGFRYRPKNIAYYFTIYSFESSVQPPGTERRITETLVELATLYGVVPSIPDVQYVNTGVNHCHFSKTVLRPFILWLHKYQDAAVFCIGCGKADYLERRIRCSIAQKPLCYLGPMMRVAKEPAPIPLPEEPDTTRIIRLIRGWFDPWSRTTHRLHNRGTRQAVATVMLCAYRNRATESALFLPTEMWEHVCSFVRRHWWPQP